MPLLRLRLPALLAEFSDDSLLAEPLLFPSVSCYALGPSSLRKRLSRRVAEVLKQAPPDDVYRRMLGELPETHAVELELEPLRDDLLRRQSTTLTFHYVLWRHGEDAVVAYVPALGIEVLGGSEKQLAELLVPQIRSALTRTRATRSLRSLVMLDRYRGLRVRPLRLAVTRKTLKEAALEQQNELSKETSILKKVASNLVWTASRAIYQRDAEVERLAGLLTRRHPQSVLLVGPSGAGKTALVEQLARRRRYLGLGDTPFWSTSGSRIVAGMTGFGMWQERVEKIVREASKTKAVLHLGNLVELIEVGKGGGNVQGVAAMLRPHLDRSAFLAIAECTPEQLAVVEREDPQFLETFAQFELVPTSPEQTQEILTAVAAERASQGPRLSSEALATVDRLHRRYATYSAAPGRPLRFLRNLLDDAAASPDRELQPRDATAAFSHETGLPLLMLDDAVELDLVRTREWFSERVIGQNEAVDIVVDLLASVKAELSRSGKPIASLLFIGPTGVGKTELAKSLAEFLYQDRGRMIRFDMSEYSHPAAVERLIGGAYAAQGLLTQKVRDQPFTVVLLDEFEKAHPLFFDVLLQVLGEGRLTDGVGRVTDFTNAVVIMTSNLGAQSFRRGAVGFGGEQGSATFAKQHFEREVKSFLRPEMFNRLDRIVPFAPLSRETIAGIARREVQHVLEREGLRFRDIAIDLGDGVVEHLAAAGFDSRYGARPLKRAIEHQLVAPLAERITQYTGGLHLDCRVFLLDGELKIEAAASPRRKAGREVHPASEPNREDTTEVLNKIVGLRRHAQALTNCGTVMRLRNEIFRLRQAERQRERRLKKRGIDPKYAFTPEQSRLLSYEGVLSRIDKLAGDVMAWEDDTLNRFYTAQPLNPHELESYRVDYEQIMRQLLFDLPRSDGLKRGVLALALFGESLPRVAELARTYEEICRTNEGQVRPYVLKIYRPDYDDPIKLSGPPPTRPPANGPVLRLLNRKEHEGDTQEKVVDVYKATADDLAQLPADCIGVAFDIAGDRAAALLEAESGRHEFLKRQGGREECVVETIAERLIKYDPPRDVGRRGSFKSTPLRRTYDFRQQSCRDALLEATLELKGGNLRPAVLQAVEDYLTKRLWELVEAWS